MIAATVVFAYLAVVLYVGIFAFRRSTASTEDFFLANRSLGTVVFLLSLFGSNMTSFAILGSSGLAFRVGIGVFGLMASISAIVIPLTILIIGTRIWALGKRFGHVTQVQIFRDRWECGHIGTVIFALQAVMLVPYIIIGVMGGGETLEGVSSGQVPYWLGGLIVALVVMGYVFFGGMRGTAWVNTLQTSMFLVFGTLALLVIAHGLGGLSPLVARLAETLQHPPPPPARPDGELLTRARLAPGYYFSYMFIPLSSIMFPHIAIFCLTAKRMASFRKTVIFYPLCILAIWLPAVFLGALAGGRLDLVSSLATKSAGFEQLRKSDPAGAALIEDVAAGRVPLDDPRAAPLRAGPLKAEARRLAGTQADGIMLDLLARFAPALLAGILGAAIMACVMASDSQILALSTMWAEDVFAFYGGKRRFGDAAQIWSARAFVVLLTVLAYAIAVAVRGSANIFEIAIQYAFSGYASMAPIMLACLFWRRSTKWGALAATLWVAACLVGSGVLQAMTPVPREAGAAVPLWSWNGTPILLREAVRISFTSQRFLLVLPMIVGSSLLMWLGSVLTTPPSAATLRRYFPEG
ncbi:MAG TPA: sodium:solute symporter family protein [Candidatus Polarisedimenticolaceae bacterium]|nr:sodium:solute symporter family protein [Candidatus Polarisedimenticolaceae bacterium]